LKFAIGLKSVLGLTSPLEIGSTFVELIKRHGTHLGVIVSATPDREPRIVDLVNNMEKNKVEIDL